jgi:hypothetical protein
MRWFLLALCLSGCATPETVVKDPNTGMVVATCGGGRAGFLLGGLTGMALEQMADQRCVDRYRDVGWQEETQ